MIKYEKKIPMLITNNSEVINGQKMYCRSGIRLVKKEFETTIRDCRTIIAYSNIINDQTDGVVADI